MSNEEIWLPHRTGFQVLVIVHQWHLENPQQENGEDLSVVMNELI